MTPADLQKALHNVEPAAVLVSARVLENMIRQTGQMSGLFWHVPHRKSFIVDRQTLFRHVDQDELLLGPDQILPMTVLLLAWPDKKELESADRGALLLKYWQRLFHASVHLALENLWAEGKLTAGIIRARLDQLGQASVNEIRKVLVEEHYLPANPDERSVYIEFAAVFLQLTSFTPHLVPIDFPILRDAAKIRELVGQDLDVQAIFERTRLAGASEPAIWAEGGSEEAHEYFWNLLRDSEEAARQGNVVRAAIQRHRAARVAPADRAAVTRQAAIEELLGLVGRLQQALSLSAGESDEWRKHLPALLDKADQGSRPVEAALLFDLQKICLDHEHEIYALDLVEWALSGGRRPIKRSLPGQRLVRVARTLRGALPRLAMARLSNDDRNQFAILMQAAVQRSEVEVRNRFRPLIQAALNDVGLSPRHPLEAVAQHKVIEELLDRIIGSGFITFSDLRDTLSRSQLKFPDLADPQDFIRGDSLLRLDRRLANLLDGVYRRGEFYLRWLERGTALLFGTPLGRLLTLFVLVPFLGAFSVLELVTLILHKLGTPRMPAGLFLSTGLGLGFFFMGLVHSIRMRHRFIQFGVALRRPLRAAFIDTPLWLARHPALKRFAESWPFQLGYWYVGKPMILAVLVLLILQHLADDLLPAMQLDFRAPLNAGLLFLAAVFFVNSRPGQAAGEALVELIMRLFESLRAGLVPNLIRMIVQLFKHILHLGEVLLFTVDEWLRFRGGDSGLAMVARALLSLAWFPVAYLVRFVIVVLIEPGINPVKLPISIIAAKFIGPLSAFDTLFTNIFTPVFGDVAGRYLATSIIYFWCLPDLVGFMIWEMKENWSLYRANRSPVLRPVVVGRHGETMRALLQPGFHSATIPWLFARLRQAERQARRTGNFSGARTCRSLLADVEEAVRLFVTREFCELLALAPTWQGNRLEVAGVALATNLIRVELKRVDAQGQPLCLEFEFRSPDLLAGIAAPGWLAGMSDRQRVLLQNALAILYKLAGIDQIREAPAAEGLTFGEIPITWQQCVECWQRDAAAPMPPLLLADRVELIPDRLAIVPLAVTAQV
jgi:hypothetical protein